ncbi:hypothetical protein DOY81_009229 [Sarcophaga bullata]|nr:hypothetical protein DOY81_009229 [Sarcophaga bullata]
MPAPNNHKTQTTQSSNAAARNSSTQAVNNRQRDQVIRTTVT